MKNNNRKSTKSRINQMITLKDKNGLPTGKTKMIRHEKESRIKSIINFLKFKKEL